MHPLTAACSSSEVNISELPYEDDEFFDFGDITDIDIPAWASKLASHFTKIQYTKDTGIGAPWNIPGEPTVEPLYEHIINQIEQLIIQLFFKYTVSDNNDIFINIINLIKASIKDARCVKRPHESLIDFQKLADDNGMIDSIVTELYFRFELGKTGVTNAWLNHANAIDTEDEIVSSPLIMLVLRAAIYEQTNLLLQGYLKNKITLSQKSVYLFQMLLNNTYHQPPVEAAPEPALARPESEPARPESEPARLESEPPRLESEPTRLESEPTRLESEPTRLESQPARLESQPAHAPVLASSEQANKAPLINHSFFLQCLAGLTATAVGALLVFGITTIGLSIAIPCVSLEVGLCIHRFFINKPSDRLMPELRPISPVPLATN